MNDPIESVRFPFAVDANAGRLAQEPDYPTHVEQMIKQLLFTAPGERVNRPDFGCGLRRMLFAPNSTVTAQLLQITILQACEKWLDSIITVDHVQVDAIDSTLQVRLVYVLKARGERRYLNLEVTA
jgi:phage baseplate assembly protein W